MKPNLESSSLEPVEPVQVVKPNLGQDQWGLLQGFYYLNVMSLI